MRKNILLGLMSILVLTCLTGCGKTREIKAAWGAMSKYNGEFLLIKEIQYDENHDPTVTCRDSHNKEVVLAADELYSSSVNVIGYDEELYRATGTDMNGNTRYGFLTDDERHIYSEVIIKRTGVFNQEIETEDIFAHSVMQYYAEDNELDIDSIPVEEMPRLICERIREQEDVFRSYGITNNELRAVRFILYHQKDPNDFYVFEILTDATEEEVAAVISKEVRDFRSEEFGTSGGSERD